MLSGACITVTVTYVADAPVFPIHLRPLLLQQLHTRILHWTSDSFDHPVQVIAAAAALFVAKVVLVSLATIPSSTPLPPFFVPCSSLPPS